MPRGNRVWESLPVPTWSGSSIRFSQLWMMPSPGPEGDAAPVGHEPGEGPLGLDVDGFG